MLQTGPMTAITLNSFSLFLFFWLTKQNVANRTFLAFCAVYNAGGTEQTDVTETLTINKEILTHSLHGAESFLRS